MRKAQSRTINLQLDAEAIKQLDALACHEDRSRTQMVRRLVTRALAEQASRLEANASKRGKKSAASHAQAATV